MIRLSRQFTNQLTCLREVNCLCLIAALLFSAPNLSHADLATSIEFKEAIQVLTDGKPSLSVQTLKSLLNQIDSQLTTTEKEQLSLLLLEALVRSEKYEEALTLFDHSPEIQKNNIARFWNAIALTDSAQLDEAKIILKELATLPKFQHQNWVRLTLVRIHTRQNELDTANEYLNALLSSDDSEIAIQALLNLAELQLNQGKINQAQTLLRKLNQATLTSDNRSRVVYLEALVDFKRGNFVQAESKFLEAGNDSKKTSSTDISTFNVALTALYAGDQKTFTQYQDLLLQSENTDLQAGLLLEQGLYLASRSVTQAFDALSRFLEKFPKNIKTADAHLALAELYLNEVPPKPVSAREQLKLASESQLSVQQQEALDYIAVWIEESDGNHSAVTEQSLLYLDHWPQFHRAAEIRLKLGDAYYREKDFSQAVVALEQLVENHPESPLIGPALLFAGKAASLSLQPEDRARAIELWERLAEKNDDTLSLYARHEQGLFKLKLDEFDDAITTFDLILEHDPPAPLELKLAVLADRGQALFNMATSRNNEPDLLSSAVQSFDSILSEPNASSAWRNQAAVRKAKCLERIGRLDEALNTYVDVVQSDRLTEGTDSAAPLAQAEWYFRAGLGAIRLLQNKKEWIRAIQIAESLANSGSSRAIEAARLADRIRLKRFIWDEPEK